MGKWYTEEQYKRWLDDYMKCLHIDRQTAKKMLDEDLVIVYNELYSD